MLQKVEKGIRGVLCHAVHRYAKTNIWKTMTTAKNHHTSCTEMSTTSMDGRCHRNFL